ncbi:FtsX-like permease family protein [Microbacterium sp. Mcb102]|uniref:FtsX-like permease family protein n=1 Tax=Microbacterium sp. Mcb102 TaxID=2926012 RepID=UPI0021C7954A|nr:FtsX-like permease family protein [Microbacterium sp. Mcb102]
MTATVDRPETRTSDRPSSSVRRPGRRARWRVAARLAHRQLRRTLLSSALIGTLVLLPIAAMTAYAVIGASMIGTPQERVTAELGRMEAWVSVGGIPDSGFWQSPIDPTWTGYPDNSGNTPEGTPIADPTTVLPSGTEAIRVVESTVRVQTPDGVTGMPAWGGEVWDERFEGRYELLDGATPRSGREIMATPAALERLGIAIGDEVVVTDGDRSYTVVGTLDSAVLSDATSALFLPASAGLSGDARWYLPDLSLSWPEVEKLNEDGVVAYSRSVIQEPPVLSDKTRGGWSGADDGALWTVLIVLIAGGLFAAYVVVMLAGAAFAVAARRQQRSLAVAASVGAAPADLRRVILLQGTTLGLISGILGLALGVGAAAVTMALLADGSATQFWGFHVPWLILAGILTFSVLVGTASAVLPARTVARTDTLSALRGARRPQRPRASRPIWGSILLILGVALTIGSAFAILAIEVTDLPWDSPLRAIPPFGIVIGPILVQIGILLSGRWLLWITAKALSLVSVAARIAARDAAANSSRTVPAFAAIAATVFVAVFAMSQTSMQNAWTARDWAYQAPVGTLAIAIQPTGAESTVDSSVASEATDAGIALADSVGASGTAVIARQPEVWGYANSLDIPADETRVIAVMPDRHLFDPEVENSFTANGQNRPNPIAVVSVDELDESLGVTVSSAQRAAYRDGAAIVTDPQYVTDGTIDVGAWSARDVYDGKAPDNIWTAWEDGPSRGEPLWERKVDAIALELPHQAVAVAVAPETAAEFEMATRPSMVIAAFDAPVPVEVRDRVQENADALGTADWILSPYFENGPPDDSLWIVPILSAVGVLVLGASGVALSLARFERRPDDATLSAIGGTNGLRRRVGLWQGLIIAGFGTLAGAVAGVLPPIGFAIQSRGVLLIPDIPWGVLALLAVALPLAIAAVSWLIPPRRAELTRRTAIA